MDKMSNLDMARKCADAMGLKYVTVFDNAAQHTIRIPHQYGAAENYWPFTNDVQAMALVKHFMLNIDAFTGSAEFPPLESDVFRRFSDESINHAIVECVACKFSAVVK